MLKEMAAFYLISKTIKEISLLFAMLGDQNSQKKEVACCAKKDSNPTSKAASRFIQFYNG